MTPHRVHHMLFVAALLASHAAHAGWIEDRADGTTVIHVKVWYLPDPADAQAVVRADVAVVNAFRQAFPRIFAERRAAEYKAHPEIYGRHNWDRVEVELHQATGITVAGVESDLLQIAGGLAPDILYLNFRKSDTYIRNHFLYPLDEYIAEMPEEEYRERVHPKIEPVIHRKGPDGTSHYWALPYGGALGKVLLYRKDLFDRHHIPYPDNNWTWEQLYDAAKTITNPGEGVFGIRLFSNSFLWLTWLWSMGGEAMTYHEETDEWRCAFGSREGAIALEHFLRVCTEKWVDEDGGIHRGYATLEADENVLTKWERGEVGMLTWNIDGQVFSRINPEVTGMVPVPYGYPHPDTGRRVRGGELNSRMVGLFAEIREKAVRDAAWELMRFYDGPEARKLRTAVLVEGGLGHFLHPRDLRRFGYEDVLRLAPKGWAETFDTAIATSSPEPYGKNSNLAYKLMDEPIARAFEMALNDELPADRAARVDILHGLLKKAEVRANEQMIGIVSPRERTLRRITAVVTLVGILTAFGFVFRRIFRTFTPPGALVAGKGSWQFRRYFWAYLLLLPALATIVVWQYAPLARGSLMAFFDYKLLGQSVFIGVDNFGNLLFDSYWWNSIWNALRYSALVLGLTFLPPIILAILLQEVPRGSLAYRTVYYLPAVITGIVTILLWKQFYQPNERGALNALVMHIPAVGFLAIGLLLLGICLAFAWRLRIHQMWLGVCFFVVAGLAALLAASSLSVPILFPADEALLTSLARIPERLLDVAPEAFRWLTDSDTAMVACVLPMVWAGMGPGCLIYLAALKGIPDDYYEAADMDGANFLDKILFVVFPMLKALIIINFVGAFIQSWYQATGNILVMTGGHANTEVVGLHIWYKAFTFLRFGEATAAAWMLGFMLIGFTVHQLQLLSRVEFKAQGAQK